MKANLQTLQTGFPLVDQFIGLVRAAFERLGDIVTNERITSVVFTGATDVTVFHGLGRPVRTWDVVDLNANVSVCKSPLVNNDPANRIILRSAGAVTISVRFN